MNAFVVVESASSSFTTHTKDAWSFIAAGKTVFEAAPDFISGDDAAPSEAIVSHGKTWSRYFRKTSAGWQTLFFNRVTGQESEWRRLIGAKPKLDAIWEALYARL